MFTKTLKNVLLPAVVLAATLLSGEARADRILPQAITFTILHGDCNVPPNGQFSLYMNGQLVRTVATTFHSCECVGPTRYTFHDPTTLAMFNPDACNTFQVFATSAPLIALGFVRIEIEASVVVPPLCLYDAAGAGCVDRNLCDAYEYDVPTVGVADADGDGFDEGFGASCDVCPALSNPDQTDSDGDGFGDACDACPGPGTTDADQDGICDEYDLCPTLPGGDNSDFDADGLGGACDNCPYTRNPDQRDTDGDGYGDACDSCSGPGSYDNDGDGTCNDVDNCPYLPNPDQADGDADGVGDTCDNCPTIPNADQRDIDGNGIGDVCQPCPPYTDPDRDDVCNPNDNCPYAPNPNQADGDGDGAGDVCDSCQGPGSTDYDRDGACDGADNCLYQANPDQADTDGDGAGDACDGCPGPGSTDYDGDGVCQDADNCPYLANPDQADNDGDGRGDVCDGCFGPGPDDDGDAVCDGVDNCPYQINSAQADRDGDGIGDVCDNCPDVSNATQDDYDGNGVGDACQMCPTFDDYDGDGICNTTDDCPYNWNPEQSDQDGDGEEDACDVDCGAIITNGTLRLGVNCPGNLNFDDPADPRGIGRVGLRYIPTGNTSLESGSPCEGWGVGDTASGFTGYANRCEGGGTWLKVVQFSATSSTAVSIVDVRDTFRVTHDYHPSPSSPYLYEVTVTIQNIGTGGARLLYRRVMDWDIEPTLYAEYATLFEGSLHGRVRTDTSGLNSASPFYLYSEHPGPVVDYGPGDVGALIDFDFGLVAPGATRAFRSFYGAAGTERDVLDALAMVRAEVFTLGQPSTVGGPDLGTPNTFVYALAGIGGQRFCESSSQCDDANPCTVDVCDPATSTCSNAPGSGQADADHDGIADACDPCPLDPQNDADHDGICGNVDACPNSIVSPTVVVGNCDSAVSNVLLTFGIDICFRNEGDEDFEYDESGHRSCRYPRTIGGNGCTISDDIRICRTLTNRPAKWIDCVERVTKELKLRHVLSEKQRGRIRKCVLRTVHGSRHPHSASHTRHQRENRP